MRQSIAILTYFATQKSYYDFFNGQKQYFFEVLKQKNQRLLRLKLIRTNRSRIRNKQQTAFYNREVVLNLAYCEANQTLSNGKAKADAFLTILEANQKAYTIFCDYFQNQILKKAFEV